MKKYIIFCFAAILSVIGAKADNVSVPDVTVNTGETNTVAISLTNTNTGYVSFQIDLTLPDGITINKAGCSLTNRVADPDQELTIGKQGNNIYRLTSTSFSLLPINGNSGELIVLSLSASAESDGGQATLTNIRFVTANSERVTMDDVSFSITVIKPSAIVTTAPTAKTLIYTGSELQLVDAGVASGGTMQYSLDGISYSTNIPTGTNADTYTVYYKVEGDANHSDSNPVSISVTINKAPLTITAKSYTITQGDVLPDFETEYEGFVNNETPNVLTTPPTLFSYATSDSDPGEYVINVYGAEAQNYDISYVNGKLTITAPEVTSGDANGDGEVDIADAWAIMDYLLGNPPAGFIAAAADVNGDGVVDIADAVAMLDIIMNTGGAGAPQLDIK